MTSLNWGPFLMSAVVGLLANAIVISLEPPFSFEGFRPAGGRIFIGLLESIAQHTLGFILGVSTLSVLTVRHCYLRRVLISPLCGLAIGWLLGSLLNGNALPNS